MDSLKCDFIIIMYNIRTVIISCRVYIDRATSDCVSTFMCVCVRVRCIVICNVWITIALIATHWNCACVSDDFINNSNSDFCYSAWVSISLCYFIREYDTFWLCRFCLFVWHPSLLQIWCASYFVACPKHIVDFGHVWFEFRLYKEKYT